MNCSMDVVTHMTTFLVHMLFVAVKEEFSPTTMKHLMKQ